jgi:hypothetical protein
MHRREFLKLLGAGAAASTVAGLHEIDRVFAANGLSTTPVRSSLATSGLTKEQMIAQFRQELEDMFAGHEMSLDFRRVNEAGEEDWRFQIHAQELYPVASAFKAFVIMYYFMTVPMDEWYFGNDADVYRVAVFSNNKLTGHVIYDVGEYIEDDTRNCMEKYNDFCMNEIGIEHGLFSWNWPGARSGGYTDQRFFPDESRWPVIGDNLTEQIGNVSTAADLAKGWEYILYAERNPRWESDPVFRAAITNVREILSIPANDYLSPIERVVWSGYTGKDGTLPVGDIRLGRVINDAGLIRTKTGRYQVSFMSTSENESVTEPALQHIVDIMRRYEERFHPGGRTFIAGQSYPLNDGVYNHGFVRHQRIRLFAQPDIRAPRVDNPVRRNTVFGMMYLMQGALVRFVPVNEHWGRYIKDDPEDDVFTPNDWTFGFTDANWSIQPPEDIYVRIADLKLIGPEQSQPVGFVTPNGAEQGLDKYILLNINQRQLALFEGMNCILRTPLVLNLGQTPRGLLYINRVLMTRNMPHYPGVPYTNFLHDGKNLNSVGYAIHGAPWQRWEETVNRRETLRRYSHGCINVPNWVQSFGDGRYTMPTDEFVFRWIGGFPNPEIETHHHVDGDTIVRVFAGNNIYQHVFDFNPPESVLRSGNYWQDVLDTLDRRPLDAPSSFFEPILF